MTLAAELLEILACPEDKGPLYYIESESVLYNPRLQRTLRDPRRHPGDAHRRVDVGRRRRARPAHGRRRARRPPAHVQLTDHSHEHRRRTWRVHGTFMTIGLRFTPMNITRWVRSATTVGLLCAAAVVGQVATDTATPAVHAQTGGLGPAASTTRSRPPGSSRPVDPVSTTRHRAPGPRRPPVRRSTSTCSARAGSRPRSQVRTATSWRSCSTSP